MFDLLITGGNVYSKDKPLAIDHDIAIKDGKIVEVAVNIDKSKAAKVIDASDKVIVPSFMDTHMHIDKALTMDDDDTVSLIAACANSDAHAIDYFDWSHEELYKDIMERSSKIVEMCVKNGTTWLKTNVLFSPTWKTVALEAMVDLKKKYKNYCDVCTCVNYPDEYREELLDATRQGMVDFVAGYPHLTPDHKAVTKDCFDIAMKYGLPVDLHCDESDAINLDCFNNISQQTINYGFEGSVTCGHVTGLDATNIPEEMVADAIELAARAKMNVTSLTSCNMYLMNSTRRGPTRVRQLLEGGVNVAVASDNVRDTFRPFGNCDLLEEALLTAQVHKFGTSEMLKQTMNLVTYNAATNAKAQNYGLDASCKADFTILDAATVEEAILGKAKKLYVLKNGNVVAKNGVIIRDFMN